MEYKTLFSGSSGNCTYVKIEDKVLLIDAGVSCKKLKLALEADNIEFSQILGILLTHEHADHVVGLKQMVDKHHVKLYTNKLTYQSIAPKYQPIAQTQIHFMEDEYFNFEDIEIQGLPISHDAANGRFYIIRHQGKKIVYLTDSGYVPQKYYASLENAHGYIIESNHEPEMVLQSRYPWHIQQRILSDKGHLSNQDCAILLKEIIGANTKYITLSHLSAENNRPDIAYNRALQAIEARGLTSDITIQVAQDSNCHTERFKI